MGTKEDWAAHYAAQGSKPDTHSFDKFTSIDNALARLVELAEKEAAAVEGDQGSGAEAI